MEKNNPAENYSANKEQYSEAPKPVLDTLTQSRELQILKSMVPYMTGHQQRMVSVIIKLIELQKTIQLFDVEPEMQAAELQVCVHDSPTERTCHMLQALKEYCTPQEQENIDSILNFFDMYASYESLFSEENANRIS